MLSYGYVGEDEGAKADSTISRVLLVPLPLLYSNRSNRHRRFDRAPVEMPGCMAEER